MHIESFGSKIDDNNADLIQKLRALQERGLPPEEMRTGIRALYEAHQLKQGEIFREYLNGT